MSSYVAQADLEAYLGVALTSNGIALFNLLSPMMQDMVDNYCNRSWNFTNPITEYFDAYSETVPPTFNTKFFTKYPDISMTPADPNYPAAGGVISVTVAGQAWDMNYVYNYGTYVSLYLRPSSVMLLNPLGFKAVQIVYNSDAAGAVPNPVKLALIMWIARKIKTSMDADKETTQVQAGTVNVKYKSDSMGGIPDFVKMVLDSYRLPALDHF